MSNSVTIRTTVPGAKQATAEVQGLKGAFTGLGGPNSGPLGSFTKGMLGGATAGLAAGVAFGTLTDALQGAGQFLGDAANEAIKDQKSIITLNQALKDNVPAWDGSTAAIDRATQAGIDLGFADDDSRAAIQKLVIATGDITKSIHLYNIAQDVARGRNISLSDATDIVAKANIGNSRALKMMGIDLGKAATSTELLGALETKYAGQADAYTKSFEGQMTVTATQAGELKESIGYGVLPALGSMVSFIHDSVVPGLQNLGNTFGDIFGGHDARIAAAAQAQADHIGELMRRQIDLINANGKDMESATSKIYDEALVKNLRDKIKEAEDVAKNSARGIDNNLADALRSSKDDVKNAMDDVMWAIKHPMELVKDVARIEGAITTLEYKRGLASNTEEINNVIDQQLRNLREQWTNLTGKAYDAGSNAGGAYNRGYKDAVDTSPQYGKHHKPKADVTARSHAVGGIARAGELAMFGEEGPELAVPTQDMAILTAAQTRGVMGGGRGGGGNINVNVSLSTRDFSNQSRHFAVLQQSRSNF